MTGLLGLIERIRMAIDGAPPPVLMVAVPVAVVLLGVIALVIARELETLSARWSGLEAGSHSAEGQSLSGVDERLLGPLERPRGMGSR